MVSCTLQSNSATATGNHTGGAIANVSSATLAVTSSTFISNAAYSGATIYNNTFEKDVAGVIIYAKYDKTQLSTALAQSPNYAESDYGAHKIATWSHTAGNMTATQAGTTATAVAHASVSRTGVWEYRAARMAASRMIPEQMSDANSMHSDPMNAQIATSIAA